MTTTTTTARTTTTCDRKLRNIAAFVGQFTRLSFTQHAAVLLLPFDVIWTEMIALLLEISIFDLNLKKSKRKRNPNLIVVLCVIFGWPEFASGK